MADVYDQLMYVIRLFAISIACGVFAVLLMFASPSIDHMPLQAELFTARIVYDGGFAHTPGTVDEELFMRVDTTELNPFPGSTVYWIGGQIRVLDPDTRQPLFNRNLTYNRAAYDILSGQQGFRRAEPIVREFPVAVIRQNGDREPGLLQVEVLYDSR